MIACCQESTVPAGIVVFGHQLSVTCGRLFQGMNATAHSEWLLGIRQLLLYRKHR